ncbi:hypothetical protein [Rubrivirga sp. IMCC43871]|uniref:hypothetical protein n=1 Tax=Rubrivirga sp. IMCC43871 TaxID=3391575 RepID=UPI00399011F5
MRALALALLLAAPLDAQPGDPVERLATALTLSADQADLVAEVFDPADPASTWTLAAELVPTLSAEQRAALMARPERRERPAGAGAGGRPRGPRGRGDRTPDPARAAVMRAARDAALGLDADASARLDAVLADLDRRETMQALREGDLPDPIAAVLTDAQGELYLAHLALSRRLRAGRR